MRKSAGAGGAIIILVAGPAAAQESVAPADQPKVQEVPAFEPQAIRPIPIAPPSPPNYEPAKAEAPKTGKTLGEAIGGLAGGAAAATAGPVGGAVGGFVGRKLGGGVGGFVHRLFGGKKHSGPELQAQGQPQAPSPGARNAAAEAQASP